ncbi:MAG TPA: putative quinol monooxygenase [Pseudolabrys sp.]|jgi:autoinducer 2-degrading protein|uniref:putative quinol monooxygenase n=1 Tax=Pseudolabrys sp. TaxID=1960880 RepID=UPI002DDCE2D8|nr:putative quinol monooxygenase [Pseudolabrys sp.]HEV2630901.1 putative quinol monooxygenase [Pseudolabrys sp.]
MSYIVTARWRPRAGETAAIEAILRELAAAIRDEPGNVSFTVHRARDDTRDIFLHEVYKSEEAFKAHREMQHFKTFVLQRAVPLLEQREIRMWSVADDI